MFPAAHVSAADECVSMACERRAHKDKVSSVLYVMIANLR